MSREVDWEDQWRQHAHHFYNGRAHVPLMPGIEFPLEPGPGFGDYSHPTTRLVIQMMRPFVKDNDVFDIGCGSGVLSVAAALLGAKSVSICDIDPKAVAHAQRNAALNGVAFQLGKPSHTKPVVLMNMIISEQEKAWAEHQIPFVTLITSGILSHERTRYLAFAQERGWKHNREVKLEKWIAFAFTKRHT